MHRQPIAYTQTQSFMPLTNNPGRLPLQMSNPTLTLRDLETGDMRSKREKTTLSQSQGQKKAPSSSKRGEYRCGKCGYFPKKTKHNCNTERARRQATGQSVPGEKSAKKTPSSSRASLERLTPVPEPTTRISASLVSQSLTGTVIRPSDPILASYNDVDGPGYGSSLV